MPPVLELERVRLSYQRRTASELLVLSNASLRIELGETIAVMGPSGCGKTTLLDAVAGFLQPDSGSIRWPRGRLRCGYVFQEYPFLPNKTVYEHIRFPLRMAREPQKTIQAKTNSWIERMGLTAFRERPIDQLSVGMKARVALATVLCTGAKLLLLDEPFRALDVETKTQVWEHLFEFCHSNGVTTVLITHDLDEAVALADRVLIMARTPSRFVGAVPTEMNGRRPLDRLGDGSHAQLHGRIWNELRTAIECSGTDEA